MIWFRRSPSAALVPPTLAPSHAPDGVQPETVSLPGVFSVGAPVGANFTVPPLWDRLPLTVVAPSEVVPAVRLVNVPAFGFEAPIVTPSICPPLTAVKVPLTVVFPLSDTGPVPVDRLVAPV